MELLQADPELPFDVLLTTYELAIADVTFLSRMHWRYGIIDEAQRLKNANSVCVFCRNDSRGFGLDWIGIKVFSCSPKL